MRFLITILVILLFQIGFGQTHPELDKVLKRNLPEKSEKDGRWVYYSEKANIERLFKPEIKAALPNYSFYKLALTNYLGYHVNEADCVVLYDSVKSKIVLVGPLWYSGVSEPLIKLCLNRSFTSSEKLINFLTELNSLMEIGSPYKFIYKSFSENVISYDLISSKGDSYTSGGNGITSTIKYNEDGIWRKISIKVKGLSIIEYNSKNPKLEGNEIEIR